MYTAVIIDDDAIAITQLKRLLTAYNNITVVRHFTKPLQALDYLKHNAIEIVFLDIKMPESNGIEIGKSFANKTQIIYTTSTAKYALDGFNLGATDYLLKPVLEDRLRKAVEKAIDLIEIKNTKSAKQFEPALQNQITVIADRKSYRLNVSDIFYVESQLEYICYYLSNTKIQSLGALKDVAVILQQHQFVRIHKSYIVNIKQIKHYTSTTVMLNNDIELSIGRMYKDEFKMAVIDIQSTT